MAKRPIVERMTEAAQKMLLEPRWRAPRVFFLTADDHAEFMATNPPTMPYATYSGGCRVTLELPCLGVAAVRQSQGKTRHSLLYSTVGTTRRVAAN